MVAQRRLGQTDIESIPKGESHRPDDRNRVTAISAGGGTAGRIARSDATGMFRLSILIRSEK
jgi:hypothetical protein